MLPETLPLRESLDTSKLVDMMTLCVWFAGLIKSPTDWLNGVVPPEFEGVKGGGGLLGGGGGTNVGSESLDFPGVTCKITTGWINVQLVNYTGSNM